MECIFLKIYCTFLGFPTVSTKMDPSARPAPPLIATRIPSGLAHRSWMIPGAAGPAMCHLFLVSRGDATFSGPSIPSLALSGPCLVWLPRAISGVFRLAAGSEGLSCAIAEDFATRVAGDSQIAAELGALLPRLTVLGASELPPILDEVALSFTVLLRETRDQPPGASAIMAAHIGLLLLHLWRGSGLTAASGRRGTAGTTAQRFRQLVELHYREKLDIEAFARLLGVTRPHLHDACLRDTGRTPLALIHDRLLAEAKLRLEQTELLVEQIGFGLGFREAAYFNRFFKRMTGQSPGSFRRSRRAARLSTAETSFAAWP
jgi:AraC family transcriptional activator of pobA